MRDKFNGFAQQPAPPAATTYANDFTGAIGVIDAQLTFLVNGNPTINVIVPLAVLRSLHAVSGTMIGDYERKSGQKIANMNEIAQSIQAVNGIIREN